MQSALAGLILIAIGTGYLIWKGSGSRLRALVGGLLLPVLAFLFVGAIIGREALQEIARSSAGWGLVAAILAAMAFLAWRHSARD